MAVNFNPLWKLLIDRRVNKTTLCQMAGISRGTITRMFRNENVSTEVLDKICLALDCEIQDIIEVKR